MAKCACLAVSIWFLELPMGRRTEWVHALVGPLHNFFRGRPISQLAQPRTPSQSASTPAIRPTAANASRTGHRPQAAAVFLMPSVAFKDGQLERAPRMDLVTGEIITLAATTSLQVALSILEVQSMWPKILPRSSSGNREPSWRPLGWALPLAGPWITPFTSRARRPLKSAARCTTEQVRGAQPPRTKRGALCRRAVAFSHHRGHVRSHCASAISSSIYPQPSLQSIVIYREVCCRDYLGFKLLVTRFLPGLCDYVAASLLFTTRAL
jgi:hypothetical protein